jgi:hypothetical protein
MARRSTVLKAARMSRLMSQGDLARALRELESTEQVQRWEAGAVVSRRPVYARAPEGVSIESLGFAPTALGAGAVDHDRGQDKDMAAHDGLTNESFQEAEHGTYSGIWLSRYDYISTGRGATFTGEHHVVVLQHGGDRLTVQSIPGSSDSLSTMDPAIDGAVCTGTRVEQTAQEGYYRGAQYHDAIQLLTDPTGRRLAGKWVGFGKDFDGDTGPWELACQGASTAKATVDQYQRPPS